jgi:hypothetical protein
LETEADSQKHRVIEWKPRPQFLPIISKRREFPVSVFPFPLQPKEIPGSGKSNEEW